MKYILIMLLLGLVFLAFIVWRTIMRSPKLDSFFDANKRDPDADEIFETLDDQKGQLRRRAKDLSKSKSKAESELDRINRYKL